MQGKQHISDGNHYCSWSPMTVGVADLDLALKLWIDECGMNTVKSRAGADEGIAKVWDIPANDIQRQVLLRTGDSTSCLLYTSDAADE